MCHTLIPAIYLFSRLHDTGLRLKGKVSNSIFRNKAQGLPWNSAPFVKKVMRRNIFNVFSRW